VNLRANLDDVEKRKLLAIPGLELRPLCRPARSQPLYRLRYPGSQRMVTLVIRFAQNKISEIFPRMQQNMFLCFMVHLTDDL
jgi:hypothetical protein